jgi:hypothetical protein
MLQTYAMSSIFKGEFVTACSESTPEKKKHAKSFFVDVNGWDFV